MCIETKVFRNSIFETLLILLRVAFLVAGCKDSMSDLSNIQCFIQTIKFRTEKEKRLIFCGGKVSIGYRGILQRFFLGGGGHKNLEGSLPPQYPSGCTVTVEVYSGTSLLQAPVDNKKCPD